MPPGRNTPPTLAEFKDAIRVWEMQLKAYPGDLPAKANIDRVKKKMGG